MSTVTYTCNASLVSSATAPAPPEGFENWKVSQAEVQAFVDALDGRQETVTGATQTDRMRKLGIALSTYLSGLSGYAGPTNLVVVNSTLGTGTDWNSTSDNVVHPRNGSGTPVQLCVAQSSGGTWYWALVVAPEP
ncbi:MAG: hypothetical protein IPJ77_15640 [Planctomycetes bacterium]|nr:hypothetical protein [Planctomycetota bacterium]